MYKEAFLKPISAKMHCASCVILHNLWGVYLSVYPGWHILDGNMRLSERLSGRRILFDWHYVFDYRNKNQKIPRKSYSGLSIGN